MKHTMVFRTLFIAIVICTTCSGQDIDPYSIGVTIVSAVGCPVFVGSILARSPAERAGIQAGDRVLAIDGNPVRNLREAAKMLQSDVPGQVSLRLGRDDKEVALVLDREKRSAIYMSAGIKSVSGVVVPADTAQGEVDQMLKFDDHRLTGRVFPTHYPLNPAIFYGGFEVFVLRDPPQVAVGGIEDGPAARAGLHWGDTLLAVDGRPTTGKSQNELESLFSAKESMTMQLQIERLGVAKKIKFHLERAGDIARQNRKRFVAGQIVPLWVNERDLHCFLK